MVSAAASSCRFNQSRSDASTAASSVTYTVPLSALLICTVVPDIVKEVITVVIEQHCLEMPNYARKEACNYLVCHTPVGPLLARVESPWLRLLYLLIWEVGGKERHLDVPIIFDIYIPPRLRAVQ